MSPRVCPTPEKKAYDSAGEATRHLELLRRRRPAAAAGEEPYKCHCRKWHVGDATVPPKRGKSRHRWAAQRRRLRRNP